jgi:ribosomal protein S18 acetylase RimI-like enzyme
MAISIKLLESQDIPLLTSARSFLNWNTPVSYFKDLLVEQDRKERIVLLAHLDGDFAGYITIRWQSHYPPFVEKDIPEIKDLRVLPDFRRRGVATALMDEAEKRIFERSSIAGIGVGLYADYGPAQRVYISRGYVPDGSGLHYKNQPVNPGHDVRVDDDLLLYFIKERKENTPTD